MHDQVSVTVSIQSRGGFIFSSALRRNRNKNFSQAFQAKPNIFTQAFQANQNFFIQVFQAKTKHLNKQFQSKIIKQSFINFEYYYFTTSNPYKKYYTDFTTYINTCIFLKSTVKLFLQPIFQLGHLGDKKFQLGDA